MIGRFIIWIYHKTQSLKKQPPLEVQAAKPPMYSKTVAYKGLALHILHTTSQRRLGRKI